MNEDVLLRKLAYAGVPAHMHDGYVDYILHGLPPGSFLMAVLENNLTQAFVCADTKNRGAMYQHVAFLYMHAPSPCWGSPAKVSAWMQHCRQARESPQAVPAVESVVESGLG